MKTISIIYFSGTGNTARFAQSIEKGASSVDEVKVNVISIDGNDIEKGRYQNDEVMAQLEASDTIIFGSATYMGSVAGQFKCFADATIGAWAEQKWKNKIAAGFTTSGGASGDKLSTLQYLQTFAMQLGMIWVGTGTTGMPGSPNPLASWAGAMAQFSYDPNNPVAEDQLLAGEAFGKRVAEVSLRFN